MLRRGQRFTVAVAFVTVVTLVVTSMGATAAERDASRDRSTRHDSGMSEESKKAKKASGKTDVSKERDIETAEAAPVAESSEATRISDGASPGSSDGRIVDQAPLVAATTEAERQDTDSGANSAAEGPRKSTGSPFPHNSVESVSGAPSGGGEARGNSVAIRVQPVGRTPPSEPRGTFTRRIRDLGPFIPGYSLVGGLLRANRTCFVSGFGSRACSDALLEMSIGGVAEGISFLLPAKYAIPFDLGRLLGDPRKVYAPGR